MKSPVLMRYNEFFKDGFSDGGVATREDWMVSVGIVREKKRRQFFLYFSRFFFFLIQIYLFYFFIFYFFEGEKINDKKKYTYI